MELFKKYKTTMKIDTSKPWIPGGFTLESNYNQGIIDFDPKDLRLHLEPEQDLEPEQEKGSIKGEDLALRMKNESLNSSVLKYLLDNPEHIPKEWKDKYGIYFWNTILLSPSGHRYVLCLYWHGGKWDWDYSWLEDVWRSNDPSAVLASSDLGIKTLETESLKLKTWSLEDRISRIEEILEEFSSLILEK